MSRLQPDYYFDSAFSIRPSFLTEKGINCVVLDIDNTLVTYGEKIPTEKANEWINLLRQNNISILIASNNVEKRVSEFATPLGLPYIFNSFKPSKKAIVEACTMFGVRPDQVAVIGDQVFTDIGCARKGGALAILTKPINDKENLFIKFKRAMERPIVKKFRKNNADRCFERSEGIDD